METLQDIDPDIRSSELEDLAALLLRNNRLRNMRLGIQDERYRVSSLGSRNIERAVELQLLTIEESELA